jgi:hypothetical protein
MSIPAANPPPSHPMKTSLTSSVRVAALALASLLSALTPAPAGAASCEIRQQVAAAGAAAPTDPDTMPSLAIDTKTPYRADLDPADTGKTAYYALRWVNTRGNPGPWSAIASYPII